MVKTHLLSDLFESTGTYNGYILGGQGKNILINNIIMDYLRNGNEDTKIFIFDSNKEHLRFVENLGGNYISLNSKKPFSVNPFSIIKTEDDFMEYKDYLINFLYAIGVTSENTDKDLNEHFRLYMIAALYAVQDECKDFELIDIYNWLSRQNDETLQPYIDNLMPFCPEGKYGEFFSGESTLNFGDRFITAIDFSDLAYDPKLKASIQAAVILHTYGNFYYYGRQTVIFINQFKEFVKDLPNAYILIDPLFRGARKRYIAIVTAIESVKDLYDNDKISRTGRIIIEYSEWKFFLPQVKTENSVEEMGDKLCLYISDTEFNLIKSLKYNDVYIKSNSNPNGGILIRFC